MINIRELPDAWEMIERLGGEVAAQQDDLYTIYYQIATTLFDYRLKHNLTQKQLAKKLGISQPMVAKLESGEYNFTIEKLWSIATKLNFHFRIEFNELNAEEHTIISQPSIQDEVILDTINYLAVGS